MKMLFPFAGPFFLAAAVLISGCGDSDAEFKSKVPTEAKAVVYLDGAAVIRNKTVEKELQKGLDEELAVYSLKKEDFAGRYLFFASPEEKWGGVVIQTKDGIAAKLFETMIRELKKKNENFTESASGKQRRVSIDKGIVILYHANLMLVSVEKKQFDFYEVSGKNSLFGDIHFNNMLSGAMRVTLPKNPDVDMVTQMVPALKNLTTVALNAPVSDGPFKLELQLIFSDEKAPVEALAALNMGLGMFAKQNAGLVKHIDRKTDGKSLLVSVDSAFFTEAAEAGRKAQARARESSSMANLKQIGLVCSMYAEDNAGNLSDSLGALIKKEYFMDGKVYIAYYDKTSVPSDGKTFTEKNTSYAYIGKGLNTGKLNSFDTIPIAFEKPWLAESDRIAVLYMDGHVGQVPASGIKTCAGFVSGLLKDNKGPEKEILLKNAKEIDVLNGK